MEPSEQGERGAILSAGEEEITPAIAGADNTLLHSPPWNRTTKLAVSAIALVLIVVFARRFSSLLGQVVVAAIIAYLLNPLVNFIQRRTKLGRGVCLLIVYLVLAVIVVGASTMIGVGTYGQLVAFVQEAPFLLEQFIVFIETLTEQSEPFINFGPIIISPRDIPWNSIRSQILDFINPVFSQSYQLIGYVAQAALRSVGIGIFVFIVSIYLALEIPRLGGYIVRLAQQPGYRDDAERLMSNFSRIWGAYLRGQVALAIVIFFVVWISLSAVGVQDAFTLGILSGFLEFLPIVGPIIGTIIAVIVALFQPDNYLGLTSAQLALLVLAIMVIIQQIENNLLVPRIVGDALDLHPLLVIIGVFMGTSLAGVLGAILAAPVLASMKLLSLYTWRKLFDLEPFQELTESAATREEQKPLRSRIGALWRRK